MTDTRRRSRSRSRPPAHGLALNPYVRATVLQNFAKVNEGQTLLADLAREDSAIAEWVAAKFTAKRDGTRWEDATAPERAASLREELARELRGDYDL